MQMDGKGYAEFLSAQGMRTVSFGSHLWVEKQRFCLENVPPHSRIHVDAGEARRLFLHGCLVLRYSCEESEGAPSFEYVCEGSNYDLHSLDAKARNKVRQGLKHCAVSRVGFDTLSRE